jgi:hypothetical protein
MGRIVVRPAGYTGFLQQLTWVQGNNIPVTAHLWGGGGGGGGNDDSVPGGSGSGGGYTQVQFTINEGDVLEVGVGGPGTGGAGGRGAAGGGPGSSYLADASLIFSTLETASPPVFRQFNSAYNTFLNTYGVWVNPTSATVFDRTYTINFPVETWYQFIASADNGADIYLDGVYLFAATSYQGTGSNGYYLAAGTKQVRILGTNTGGPGAVALTIGGATNFGGSYGGSSGSTGVSGAGGGGGGATVVLLNGSALGAAGGGGGGGGGGNTGAAIGQSAPGTRGQAAIGTNEGQSGTTRLGDGGGGGGGGGGWGGGNGGTVPGGDQGGFAGAYGGSSGAGQNPSGRTPGGSAAEYYRSGVAVGGAGSGSGSVGYAVFEFDVPGTIVNTSTGGWDPAIDTYVKINGTWIRVETPYIKQGGIWYPINGYAPIFQNVDGRFGASPRAAVSDTPEPSPYEGDRGGWDFSGRGWVDTVGGAGAGGGADCFTADSLVSMADGSSCRIADVKIGDHVVNRNGSGINCVKFIEIAMDTRWGQLYSPNDHMLPFATINHPLYIGDQLCSVDPEECYNMYPWLGKTQKLSTINIEPAKGVTVYNLWVGGDGTYTVNGYGTTSIIGDGSFVTACFEKGYLTVEDVLTQVGYFADHGKYVQYGAVLINKLLKHSNIEWVNKLIARAIKNGNYSKKIIKLFAQIVGYIAHPNK